MVDLLPSISLVRRPRLRTLWRRATNECRAMRQRARSRRELRMLAECDFRDLGISRSEARVEASKPFWRR